MSRLSLSRPCCFCALVGMRSERVEGLRLSAAIPGVARSSSRISAAAPATRSRALPARAAGSARRSTISGSATIVAGLLPNTPDNLVTWLKTPQRVVPGNAMPNMELNEHDAHDVAAYLYTLR